MTAIYYVEDFNLHVVVIDDAIFRIWKDKAPRSINPHATKVRGFEATLETIHVEDGLLYLDGFALTDLLLWLHHEMPNATFKTLGRRFFKFFPGSIFISDLLKATFRCATGNEHKAHGEDAYYCRKVRDAHPSEFAELRAAWSERFN